MAKSSRSPKATEGNMVQFIVETMENANIARLKSWKMQSVGSLATNDDLP